MPEFLRPVFLQKRSLKAGAQTCLARLVCHPSIARLAPVVVCGEEGWLSEELRRHDIEVVILAFPAPRSLVGRLWNNRRFCRQLAGSLAGMGEGFLIHGNDHQEAPLVLELGRLLRAPTALFLRSPSMTQRDYIKYRCAEVDMLMTVGEELLDSLRLWAPDRQIPIVSDGVYSEELRPPPAVMVARPRRFLVLGSPLRWKGWRDFLDALVLLQGRGQLPRGVSFDFTGSRPGEDNPLGLERLDTDCCRFLGRRTDFPGLALEYDFIINPSRHETFGMAAIEIIGLGLPLLSSDCGVIANVLDAPSLLYPAGDTQALAERLSAVLQGAVPDIEQRRHFQEKIRSQYLIDHSAQALLSAYRTLVQ